MRTRKITLGEWIQIGALVVGFGIQAVRAETKVTEVIDELHRIEYKFDRVEKYLSSKDVNYWETIRKLEEPPEQAAPPIPR
ncbi:MAG TPA: hypothetical protein VKP61_15105 [Candidatus Acidoferrum sp.]|nr:hypothetical protein [Candidatus Acidoferrum sp.]